MKQRPFLVFISVVFVSVVLALSFIQSRFFARLVKSTVATQIPRDLGVDGDFSEFSVRLFPPGISIHNPKVVLQKSKIIDLPPGSAVQADRIDLIFRPFQMLSGNIRVHRVEVIRGEVRLAFDRAYLNRKERTKLPTPAIKLSVHWDELFRIRAENIVLRDTTAYVSFENPKVSTELKARLLQVGQWSEGGSLGYLFKLDLSEINGKYPASWNMPEHLESMVGSLKVNALGATLEEFKATQGGLHYEMQGRIRGNLLNPTDLLTDGRVRVEADLSEFTRWLNQVGILTKKSPLLAKDGPKGSLDVEAEFSGNARESLRKFRLRTRAVANRFQWKGFAFQKAQLTGKWENERVEIEKVLLEGPHGERALPSQPGTGGRVEIGPVSFAVGQTTPVQVPVELTDAHLHWLMGPVMPQVFNLTLRASGQVTGFLTPPKDWENPSLSYPIRAKTLLKFKNLTLDGANFGSNEKSRKTLEVADVDLNAEVDVMPGDVSLKIASLHFASTTLAGTGKIDGKGLDLRVTGPVDLANLGHLAESPIRGKGLVSARAWTQAGEMNLSFDTTLEDAAYLNLNLGKINGVISFDDATDWLKFDGFTMDVGRTQLKGGGRINVGPDKPGVDEIAMEFGIKPGTTTDLFKIFEHMTDGLTWLPRELTGSLEGKIVLSGGIDLDSLRVMANLNGRQWTYLGESFQSVMLSGGYDRGRYLIDGLQAKKRYGNIFGKLSYEPESTKMTWEVGSDGLQLGDSDHMARLDVPIRGVVSVQSHGQGNVEGPSGGPGTLESETKISVRELSVRGNSFPAATLSLKNKGSKLEASGGLQGNLSQFNLDYDLKPGAECGFAFAFNDFDFSPFLLLLNPDLMQDRDLVGKVSGELALKFRSGQMDVGSGVLGLTEYRLKNNLTELKLKAPVKSMIESGSFSLPDIQFVGAKNSIRADLSGKNGSLNGEVNGLVDLGILTFFTPSLASVQGAGKLALSIDGTLKAPELSGKFTVEDSLVQLKTFESPFENVSASFVLKQNQITIQSLDAILASGRVAARGDILLYASKAPTLNLTGSIRDSRLKVYPFQFIRLRGALKAEGSSLPYLVSGDLVVDSALAKEKVLNSPGSARGAKVVRFAPKPRNETVSDTSLFTLNIHVKADRGIQIKNDLFDGEAKGDVRIVNTIDTPRILGRADLIQGRMSFKDRVFQIQSAFMDFDNPNQINPRLGLNGTTELSNTKIQLFATGRLDDFKIELSSSPSLPQNEILSLLALGTTSSDLNRVRAEDQSLVQSGNAASLVLSSLDFNREIREKTGFQIQIDDAVNSVVGNSIFSKRSDSTVTSVPKIVIRRQITKRFDVSVGSTVGLGNSIQRQVNAEYQVTRGASVLGVWNSIDGVDASNSLRSSFGFDLKLQRRFK